MSAAQNAAGAAEWSVINADCVEFLKTLPDESFDSLVTDPPAGISFMGKKWDSDKGGRDAWIAWLSGAMREVIRIMKPGAHGLVWALPRTSHWTATALEDAGFEIRDVITHHFGTGFPKSLDVSKAIDAAAGAEREVVGHTANARPNRVGKTTKLSGPMMIGGEITEPQTIAAKQWAGWGTALKPASEHWILVRKPLDGTVAANVQRHGTGALNIDGCRIEGKPRTTHADGNRRTANHGPTYDEGLGIGMREGAEGRWPANLVLSHGDRCGKHRRHFSDEHTYGATFICIDCREVSAPERDNTCSKPHCDFGCPVAELDAQSGVLRNGGQNETSDRRKIGSVALGDYKEGSSPTRFAGDTGGASRFFYCAKPSRRERGEGNIHPTVKAKALMGYLIKMITPPGGLILDPFCGSGSTGVAAVGGGWSFLGIEQDAAFAKIAEGRIAAAAPDAKAVAA